MNFIDNFLFVIPNVLACRFNLLLSIDHQADSSPPEYYSLTAAIFQAITLVKERKLF